MTGLYKKQEVNYAGKKIFAINKISNTSVIKEIIKISENS